VHELTKVNGIGEAKACIILAALELGRRIGQVRNPERPVVSSPADVDRLLRGRIANLDRENFVVVLLNTKNEVTDTPMVSVGTLSASLVHPREVFKPAIRASAASVILAHNHPSGKEEAQGVCRDPGYRGVGSRYRGRRLLQYEGTRDALARGLERHD
jgi:DNA repair protein RadC